MKLRKTLERFIRGDVEELNLVAAGVGYEMGQGNLGAIDEFRKGALAALAAQRDADTEFVLGYRHALMDVLRAFSSSSRSKI